MKLLFTTTFLLSIACVPAHAGFFDFLTGKDEKTAPAEPIAEAPPAPSTLETATQVASGLIPTLTGQLGITETQAQGGMGSLLGLAKQSLSSDEFSELGSGIPGMETLLAAAPALAGQSGAVSGLLSSAGGLAGSVGGIAQLTEQFEALGLSSDMITQIASIAVKFFTDQGGNTADLLTKGLSAVLS